MSNSVVTLSLAVGAVLALYSLGVFLADLVAVL